MTVEKLRNYGVAWSEAERSWPAELKRRMRRDGKAVVMRHLGPMERLRFLWAFLAARRRAARLDLSAVRAKGLADPAFVAQQLEYLALFAGLAEVVGKERAVRILEEVMQATAREALLLCLPDGADLAAFPDPFDAWRAYSRAMPAAARAAGCHAAAVVDEGDDAFRMDVTWCAWLELARAMGVPEGCLPNCYADDLVFPDYFRALGIAYRRTGTLAQGAPRCDFRFARGGG